MRHWVNTGGEFCHLGPGKHKSFALCNMSFRYNKWNMSITSPFTVRLLFMLTPRLDVFH